MANMEHAAKNILVTGGAGFVGSNLAISLKRKHPSLFVTKINNASIVTRYPEDFSKLLDAYPKEIAQDYLNKSKEAVQCLKEDSRLKE